MSQIKLTLVVAERNLQEREPSPVMYRVTRVVGSADYWPGQFLTRDTVRDLCNMTGKFTVTVERREQ